MKKQILSPLFNWVRLLNDRIKKGYTFFCIVAIIISLIAGCSKKEPSNADKVKEPISAVKKEKDANMISARSYCDPCGNNNCGLGIVCVVQPIQYAGITIYYEPNFNNGMGVLRFNSIEDITQVISYMDREDENYNTNYENQYADYTPDQLDEIDEINGFDPMHIYRSFENQFPGFISARKNIEIVENAYLDNNFTGADPDDIDFTADDAENSILNSINAYKIGNDIYQVKEDGVYKNDIMFIENIVEEGGSITSRPRKPCIRGRISKSLDNYYGGSVKVKLKVAFNSIILRSSGKGKVVWFKKNRRDKWKRSRAELSIATSGNVYYNNCTPYQLQNPVGDRNPQSGYKKRSQLKAVWRQWQQGGYSGYLATKSREWFTIFSEKGGANGILYCE